MSNYPLVRFFSLAITGVILSACSTATAPPSRECNCPKVEKPVDVEPPKPTIEPAAVKSSFDALPGWAKGNHTQLLRRFVDQCSENGNALAKRKSTPQSLLDLCRKARGNLQSNPTLPAQIWIESQFDVYQLQKEDGSKEGLLTGYYEPRLKGSRTAQGPYKYPLYGEPADLITVELASLDPDLKGKRLRGRLQGNKLVPYFDNAAWQRLGPDREQPIVWLDDRLDAFLIQVQGSGRVLLPDGKEIRLGYANQNGHPYRSIGATLVQWGELKAEEATIPGIRRWAEKNPARLNELLNSNPSVVFFEEKNVLNPEDGPIGAMGTPLHGELSLAVDRSRIPYGSLLWIKSIRPDDQSEILQGALAQDTGGAIRGRVRADYFWGTGKKAGELAGLTRQPLQMWILWPKGEPLPDMR